MGHNERFAVTPLRSDNMHRPLSITVDQLTDILCHREQRYVGSQLTRPHSRLVLLSHRRRLGGSFDDGSGGGQRKDIVEGLGRADGWFFLCR